jgi:hypothetical protein
MPSNDAANNYPMNEQIANYDSLVSILNINGIPFWMSTTQPRNFSNQSQLNLLFSMKDSTYSRYNSHAVDFWTNLAQTNGWINSIYNSGDGIHLNNAAHRILFERMLDAVTPVILSSDLTELSKREIDFKLNNNYPNPFNPNTTISFNIPVRADVKLNVINLLGEKVANLISSELEAGQHSINFNAKGLSSGFYLYTISATGFDGKIYSANNKMILLK